MRYVILTILLLMAKPALAECMLDTCINSIRGPDNAITVSPTLSHDITKDPRTEVLAETLCNQPLWKSRNASFGGCRADDADKFLVFWDKMKEIEAKNKPAPVREGNIYFCVTSDGRVGHSKLGEECK